MTTTVTVPVSLLDRQAPTLEAVAWGVLHLNQWTLCVSQRPDQEEGPSSSQARTIYPQGGHGGGGGHPRFVNTEAVPCSLDRAVSPRLTHGGLACTQVAVC